jgi:predicted nucleotidyltransferase
VNLADLAARLRDDPTMAGLRLLVLHGSRARGDNHPGSDWDFAVLADKGTDLGAVMAALTEVVGTDSVDVVELHRASALLRYRAARDGVPLLERPEGTFLQFQLEAVQFWCDAEPIIRKAQDDVLAALG